MDNKLIVERVFELQKAIRGKNDARAIALQRSIMSLLEYPKPLSSAKRRSLLALQGVGPKVVDLILRVIAGDDIDVIAASVPSIPKRPQAWPRQVIPHDSGNWNGSWDDIVKTIEGD